MVVICGFFIFSNTRNRIFKHKHMLIPFISISNRIILTERIKVLIPKTSLTLPPYLTTNDDILSRDALKCPQSI